jgi:hypothetical protein
MGDMADKFFPHHGHGDRKLVLRFELNFSPLLLFCIIVHMSEEQNSPQKKNHN